MTKLILSSCDFRNPASAKCIYDNLPKPVEQCRILYFPNEKATDESIKSEKYINRISEFGFRKENIMVFNYFSPDDFDRNTIVDVIYISGGNTFGTLKRIRESGADRIITDYVNNGVLYIGGSAGAHIACSDIAHVVKYDDETYGLTDFSGLHLYDGVLICHYSAERQEDYIRLTEQGNCRVTALRDRDFLIIE